MRILLLSIFIFSNCFAFSNETKASEAKVDNETNIQSSYSYYGLGIGPLPVPAFTISAGNRVTFAGNHLALDTGVTLATLVRYNALRAYINGLCYINQKPDSQYYIGIGGSIGVTVGFDLLFDDQGFVSPNFLIGKEFFNCKKEKRFFQIEVVYPAYFFKEKEIFDFMPLITLKYGTAF